MTLLPVVERELRVVARRRSTHWVRFFVGLVVLSTWIILNFTARQQVRPAELSLNLFIATNVVGFLFALLSGVFLTADCLSAEKRDGTLGLLFLTDLRGHDVVLGKLAATSLNAIYGLLAIFPVSALSLLLGGVTAGEFFRLALVLLVTLFFSLSLGMFVSALVRETQHAMLIVFAGLLFVSGLVPLISGMLQVYRVVRFEENPLNSLSPVFSFAQAFDVHCRKPAELLRFYISIAVQGAMGATLLTLACVALPRRWQARVERPRPAAPPSGASSQAESLPTPRSAKVGSDPFLWLANRLSRASFTVTLPMAVLCALWLSIFLLTFTQRGERFAFVCSLFGAYAVHFSFKCLVAVEASRRFSMDRRSGALELLLATPLGVKEIVDGHRQALLRAMFFPRLQALVPNIALLLAVLRDHPHNIGREGGLFVFLLLGGAVVLFADTWALQWVGMEQGLVRRRHHWAVLATLGKVMLGPWIGVFLFVFLTINGAVRNEDTVEVLAGIWLVLAGVLDAVVGFAARNRLQDSFRRLVAQEK